MKKLTNRYSTIISRIAIGSLIFTELSGCGGGTDKTEPKFPDSPNGRCAACQDRCLRIQDQQRQNECMTDCAINDCSGQR
jgi:hypothetical protein